MRHLSNSGQRNVKCYTMGALFWDYSMNSYFSIRITEHTEYQFPKEQTLCCSENRIADITKIDMMRLRKSGYTIFPPIEGQKLPKEHDYWLFGLLRTNCYSVDFSRIIIGPKRT